MALPGSELVHDALEQLVQSKTQLSKNKAHQVQPARRITSSRFLDDSSNRSIGEKCSLSVVEIKGIQGISTLVNDSSMVVGNLLNKKLVDVDGGGEYCKKESGTGVVNGQPIQYNETLFYSCLVQEENALLRECLFILQGISTERLRFSSVESRGYTKLLIKSFALDGHKLVCSSSLVHRSRLGGGARDILQILGQGGLAYKSILSYADRLLRSSTSNSITRALASALENEMNSYLSFLSTLSLSLQESLHHLLITVRPKLDRLALIRNICQSWQTHALTDVTCASTSSIQLINFISAQACSGDSRREQICQSLWKTAVQPWWQAVLTWVAAGELEDSVGSEFFIRIIPNVAVPDLWRCGFVFLPKNIPSHTLTMDEIRTAALIGKGINYIQSVLEEEVTCANDENNDTLLTSDIRHIVTDRILRTSLSVNAHILSSLRCTHHLSQHLLALKQFLLLGQGDFVSDLVLGLWAQFGSGSTYWLEQRSNNQSDGNVIVGSHRHTANGILESSILSSNASNFPAYVLRRLTVDLEVEGDKEHFLNINVGNRSGAAKSNSTHKYYNQERMTSIWDIFSLSYSVPDPLVAIFPASSIAVYQKMFRFLFGIRKLEVTMDITWRQNATLLRELQRLNLLSTSEIGEKTKFSAASLLLRRFSITLQSLMHFCRIVKSYIMFDVIETEWKRLASAMEVTEKLDDLIEAHNMFLVTISRKSMLIDSSVGESEDIDKRASLGILVRELFCLSSDICAYQESLLGDALQAADRIAQARAYALERETSGSWGFTSEIENAEQISCFGLSDASKVDILNELSVAFSDRMQKLLKHLDERLNGRSRNLTNAEPARSYGWRRTSHEHDNQDDNDSLRFLEFQLTHNDFYKFSVAL